MSYNLLKVIICNVLDFSFCGLSKAFDFKQYHPNNTKILKSCEIRPDGSYFWIDRENEISDSGLESLMSSRVTSAIKCKMMGCD